MDRASRRIAWLLAAAVALGFVLRLPGAARGVVTESWREADMAAIARNYVREGMNPFYPRIDWRGDGPGFAEMEFPFLPWGTAWLYRAFGLHEALGRAISLAASLLSVLLFAALARRVLPPVGAAAAAVFFALNPLSVRLASALQPEPLMVAGILASVLFFHRWLEGERQADFWLALGSLSFALLAKLPALHVGVLLALLAFERLGWGALRRPRVWLLACGALLPAAAWYLHAHRLWATYGNSLGLSNEYHWFGLDLLRTPGYLLNIPRMDVTWIFMPAGLLLAILGLAAARSARPFRLELYWLGAVYAYYLAAARTTADGWAFYYHIASLPPAALLVGRALAVALGTGAGAEGAAGRKSLVRAATATAAVALFAVGLSHEGRGAIGAARGQAPSPLLACARSFSPLVPEGALVVASGSSCLDETQKPVAFNSPYMFYWLDRRGFNTCEERQSLAALAAFARRGARFFVMEKAAADRTPGFAEAVREVHLPRAECAQAVLFELGSGELDGAAK
jgi:4-amino-4-deoxy-L-arabinose transferase-like glycosyltransferase